MGKIDRVILIVIDGLGVGEAPDAADYSDSGTNTLAHLLEALHQPPLPHLFGLGLGRLLPGAAARDAAAVSGCFGKMAERSCGKDSTTGHWELMGVVTKRPHPTYPQGFPDEILRPLEKRIGRKCMGNVIASGTEIIKSMGEEHMRTGRPIVYTSVDSVFQIAAHEKIIPLKELYGICAEARKILKGKHAMGRVIARPFIGKPGAFTRTTDRKDFTLAPPSPTVLDKIHGQGGQTIGIGKVGDLFSNRGLSHALHTASNAKGVAATLKAMRGHAKARLIFTNLVDTDMLYGHRNDVAGYYRCLKQFDDALPRLLKSMRGGDALFITSDHGCDPTTPGTDHTREFVPLLVTGPALNKAVDLGLRKTFADVGQTILELLGHKPGNTGNSFAKLLLAS